TYTQWVKQTIPVNKPISGIKFIDSLKGWACTSIGTGGANYAYILYTTNGGTNWLLQDSSFNATYGAICILNSNIAYCGGYDFTSNSANLKKTTNGGANWISIPTPTNMAIGDMVFLNQDSGWSCSSNIGPDVRTTTNGGLNWIVRTSGIAQQTQRLFFLNYNTGFCGANSFLYKTTNAGLIWVLIGNFTEQVKSIFFPDQNTGWVGATGAKIFFTTNSGINWLTQTTPGFAGTTTDIYFVNSQTGWGGGSTSVVCKTTNGGSNWGYQLDTSQSFRISILDSLIGWTAQFGISRTTNGGGIIVYTGFVNNGNEVPVKFILHENYPNPFNPATTIKLDLPKSSNVNLIICDMLGRELYSIVNEYLRTGSYEFTWDARSYSSGIYFYRLTTNNFTETKKMILIK
ncbi:MAG: T9SS type A sorting domain-containing protein, partial [Ignavibacteria bacterium]